MGFGYFGIQYYGECWADKIFTFPKKKKSCIDGVYKKCNKTGSNRICTGKIWTNFVYEVSVQKQHKYCLAMIRDCLDEIVLVYLYHTFKCRGPYDVTKTMVQFFPGLT